MDVPMLLGVAKETGLEFILSEPTQTVNDGILFRLLVNYPAGVLPSQRFDYVLLHSRPDTLLEMIRSKIPTEMNLLFDDPRMLAYMVTYGHPICANELGKNAYQQETELKPVIGGVLTESGKGIIVEITQTGEKLFYFKDYQSFNDFASTLSQVEDIGFAFQGVFGQIENEEIIERILNGEPILGNTPGLLKYGELQYKKLTQVSEIIGSFEHARPSNGRSGSANTMNTIFSRRSLVNMHNAYMMEVDGRHYKDNYFLLFNRLESKLLVVLPQLGIKTPLVYGPTENMQEWDYTQPIQMQKVYGITLKEFFECHTYTSMEDAESQELIGTLFNITRDKVTINTLLTFNEEIFTPEEREYLQRFYSAETLAKWSDNDEATRLMGTQPPNEGNYVNEDKEVFKKDFRLYTGSIMDKMQEDNILLQATTMFRDSIKIASRLDLQEEEAAFLISIFWEIISAKTKIFENRFGGWIGDIYPENVIGVNNWYHIDFIPKPGLLQVDDVFLYDCFGLDIPEEIKLRFVDATHVLYKSELYAGLVYMKTGDEAAATSFKEDIAMKAQNYVETGDKIFFEDPVIKGMNLDIEGYRHAFFLSRVGRNYYQSHHTRIENKPDEQRHYQRMLGLGFDYLENNFNRIWSNEEQHAFEMKFGMSMRNGLEYLRNRITSQ